jgi:hypothetical protein
MSTTIAPNRTPKPNRTESISYDLIASIRYTYSLAPQVRATHPLKTPFAFQTYIVACAAVESFVNEMFLSEWSLAVLDAVFHKRISRTQVKKNQWNFAKRILELPRAYFGKTLNEADSPYRDMKYLIALRNDIVHYEMSFEDSPNQQDLLQYLQDIGVTAGDPEDRWTDQVTTLNGMRWAHNTACGTIKAIVRLAPTGKIFYLSFLANRNTSISFCDTVPLCVS